MTSGSISMLLEQSQDAFLKHGKRDAQRSSDLARLQRCLAATEPRWPVDQRFRRDGFGNGKLEVMGQPTSQLNRIGSFRTGDVVRSRQASMPGPIDDFREI